MKSPPQSFPALTQQDLTVTEALLQISADGILISDRQHQRVSHNQRFQEMWTLPDHLAEQQDVRAIWKFVSQQCADSDAHLARIQEIESSEFESFDILELNHGEYFERRSTLLRIDAEPAGRIWYFRNVTQHHEIDRISRRLAAIVENSDDAIVGKDLHGLITSWNGGAERIFGYTAEEMVGKSIMKLVPENRRDEEKEILARIARGERFEHFETVRVTKDGRSLHVSLTVSPIKNTAGKVIGASKIARDITERKSIEKALTRAKEAAEEAMRQRQRLIERERSARAEAEKASRMKDEFLANLSHELRTPLNAILGWATVLRSDRLNENERRQGLDTIERNARAQAQIIGDLLDMSRIISGKVRLETERLDLSLVLTEAIDTVRTTAEAKQIRLHMVKDFPDVSIVGDSNRLQQVFWNLLNNAIKFTPKEGNVEVRVCVVDSHVEIRVIDSGEGIAEEFLPYIFNRFQQADATSTRKHGGLGLGLAIVKQLVELHGGRVQAKSEGRGKGAEFLVELPLIPGHSEQSSGRSSDSPAPAQDALPLVRLDGARILIIDDEPDARCLLRRLLSMAGADAAQAGSAEEGMNYLLGNEVDVMICDIGMPEEDGYSFIRKVRGLPDSQKSTVPALALTAYARLQDRTEAIRAGFQKHLAKPVEPAELLAALKRMLEKKA